MTRVLRIAAYRRLFVAYTLNELAFSIASLALALLVYRRTGSAIGAAAFFICSQFLPAVLSPALVARLDQRGARGVLTVLYGAEALLFGALAWIASNFSLAPALALIVADGLLAVTARAIARAAAVQVTRPVGLLREGNALANASFSVCFMVGPAIGAAIVSLAGTATALLVNAGVFAVMAAVLATAHGLSTERFARDGSGWLSSAFAYINQNRAVRSLFVIQAVALLCFTISIPVEVVFVQRSLHGGVKAYGALLSAWGAGTVAGSVIYARWRAATPAALIGIGSAALGLGFCLMAIAPSLGLAVTGAVVAGIGNGVEAVAARTALQERIEESWMALMMSFNESMFQIVPGGGIVLGGAISALAGPRPALAAAGAGSLMVGLLSWLALRPGTAAITIARSRT
jgi:hypothetical protein